MKRIYTASEEKKDNALEDVISTLDSDFEYIMSGLEKLLRSGANAANDAAVIAENLGNDLKRHIADIASKITE